MTPLRLSTACLVLGLTLTTGVAAQDVDEATLGSARTLGYEGVERFQQGDYQGAVERLGRAYQVVKAPSLGLWSARALVKVGRLVEASERYLEVTRLEVQSGEKAVQRKAQADAESEREALLPKIPSVVVEVEGAARAEVKVSIDGVAIPSALIGVKRAVNPGTHRIRASFGADVASESVTLKEGEATVVTLRFPTDGSKAPGSPLGPEEPAQGAPVANDSGAGAGSTQRLLGWVAIGLGGAGLVTGATTAIMATSTRSSIDDQCRDGECLPPAHDDVDKYNSLRTISTIGFVAGGVLAASGVTLLVTAPSKPKEARTNPRLSAWLGFGSVGVRGSFR